MQDAAGEGGNVSWLRLQSDYFVNPTTMRAGWEGSIVFLAAMTMSKLHGWDGALPRDEFVTDTVKRHLGCHSDFDFDKGLTACLRCGLLTEDATHYQIRNWRKFQPDPTAARRKREQRARERKSQRHSDDRESRPTGRDRTRQEEPPPPPQGGRVAGASGNGRVALRPRDRERYERILEYVVRCGTTHADAPDGRRVDVARSRRVALRSNLVTDEQIATQLATDYAWVTKEKLARFKGAPA